MTIISIVKLLIPRTYGIYAVEAMFEEGDSAAIAHRWRKISEGSIPAIESVRPGYGLSARRYLEQGHSGFMAVMDDKIVAMGWLYVNQTAARVRLKGYFSLLSRSAYLHADWTHPEYRGRGLHSECILWRYNEANRDPSCDHILASIEPDNGPSIRNYQRLGFRRTGTVKVWPMARKVINFVRGGSIVS